MKKNISIIIQILSILCTFFYFQSLIGYNNSSGRNQFDFALGLYIFGLSGFILLILGGLFYYYNRLIFKKAIIFHIFIFIISIIIIISGFSYVKDSIKDAVYEKNYKEWRDRVFDKVYNSKKMGISFDYISEGFSRGFVTVKEERDTIKLYVGEELYAMIKMYHKDKNINFINLILNDFGKKGCSLYGNLVVPSKFQHWNRRGYYIERLYDGCLNDIDSPIDFPPKKKRGVYNEIYAIFNIEYPDRYYIIVSGNDIDASKDRTAFNHNSWMTTIQIK